MIPLPLPTVPLVDQQGKATRIFRAFLSRLPGIMPNADAALTDGGKATVVFYRYLFALGIKPMLSATTVLTDDDGKPLPVFTRFLMQAAK